MAAQNRKRRMKQEREADMYVKIVANLPNPLSMHDVYYDADTVTVRKESRDDIDGGFVFAVDIGRPYSATRFVDPHCERIYLMNNDGRTIDSY